MMTMPTGKYKGQPLDQIPFPYFVNYYYQKFRTMDPELRDALAEAMSDPKKCVMTYGKYKGYLVSEIRLDYLQWLAETLQFGEFVAPWSLTGICNRAVLKMVAGTEPAPQSVFIPFGQHKGKTVDEVPRDYLQWLVTQKLPQPLREAAEAELKKPDRTAETLKEDLLDFLDRNYK